MPDKGDVSEPAFRSLARNAPAFHIWRVENLQLIPVPKDQYGTFFDADCYLLYAASEYSKFITADTMVCGKGGGKLEVHVHAWLGSESCQEEHALALYKGYELACLAPASLHREPMGHESPRFRAYFNHIRHLRGTASESNNNFEARLVRVSGRRRPVARQTAALDRSCLVTRGVFVLDTRDVVFVWAGRDADPREKLNAAKIAMKLKEEHKAVSIVFIDQGRETQLSSSEQLLLSVYLRPDHKNIMDECKDDGDEARLDVDSKPHLKLYKCYNAAGLYKMVEIRAGPPLHRSHLESNSCYILDNWWECVWVWVGRNAGERDASEALGNAHGFVRKKRYPDQSTRLARLVEGAEPQEFISLFSSWPSPRQGGECRREESLEAGEASVSRVTSPPVGMVLPGLQQLPPSDPFFFYSSESYMVTYTLPSPTTPVTISTQWIGYDYEREGWVSGPEGSTSAVAHQGREPAHLLAALRGHLLVLQGPQAPSPPDYLLLAVTGNAPHNTSATQVELCPQSLNSRGVFVLVVGGVAVWVWCGKGSTGDHREAAKSIASSLSPANEFSVVYQGQEKDEFWECVGGGVPAQYQDLSLGPDDNDITNGLPRSATCDRTPRLFQVSSVAASIRVEEIINYSQADLLSEDVMLLDTSQNIFVWIGQRAKREERTKALHFASEFIKWDVSGRDERTPIMQIQQGFEPLLFTRLFNHWDPNMSKEMETYEKVRDKLEREKPMLQVELEPMRGPQTDFYSAEKFPLQTLLQRDPTKLPLSIDLLHKECHLSQNDFVKTFDMKYDEFSKLPHWKQVSLKKEVGLF